VRARVAWAVSGCLWLVGAGATDAQTVVGTCADLKSYRDTYGVVDDEGVPHPGSAGWTNYHFYYEIYYTDIKKSRKWAPELRSPKRSLTCFKALASVVFKINPQSRTLTWQANGCNLCNCEYERKLAQDSLDNHELRHALDALTLANQWTKEFKELPVGTCLPGYYRDAFWEDVVWRVEVQISNLVAPKMESLLKAADAKSAAFHISPTGTRRIRTAQSVLRARLDSNPTRAQRANSAWWAPALRPARTWEKCAEGASVVSNARTVYVQASSPVAQGSAVDTRPLDSGSRVATSTTRGTAARRTAAHVLSNQPRKWLRQTMPADEFRVAPYGH
jgi:hypothetical protein